MSAEFDAEGARRLVYFYSVSRVETGKRAVVCPDCYADTPLENAAWVRAHYTADRTLRCSSCLIVIGPINEGEQQPL